MTKTFSKVFSLALILALVLSALPVQSVSAAPTELFFTEYIEGSSNNKALEIYNGTGAPINLTTGAFIVQMFFNGSSTAGLTISLTGTVANGDVYVVTNQGAVQAIKDQADLITASTSWFNGDDAIVLRKGGVSGTIIDVIGQVGFDPGAEWGTGLISTQDNTLRRKGTIEAGDTNGGDAFNPATEWDGFATDTFCGLGNIYSDCAPNIANTVPADGATGVARNVNIVINFSEPVNVSGTWFTISCAMSGAHTATVTGGPTSFTLNPDVDFAANELCMVNILASQVTDQDTNDPPDNMPADFTFSVTSADVQVCGDPTTLIHAIQGSGTASPIIGSNVAIEGVVVGDFQGAGQFSGFYVQEEDADADSDPATSEGIFVFAPSSADVNVGDEVRVRGTVTEFNNLTELGNVVLLLQCSPGNILPSSANVNLPVATLDDWEAFEGMLINITENLTVTETFTLARFGEVSLSASGRLFNPTNVVSPGTDANNLQDLNNRSRIVLDDANNQQNIDPTIYPAGGLSASNTLRSGDTVNGITGVLEQRFGVYRVQPVGSINFNASNPRPAAPEDVGGRLKVSAMNVLNYFNGDGLGGGFPTARGATTATEFTRQRDKIISAITGLNADIIGLMEIENDATPNSAIEDLVAGLNAASGAGTYAFINTGIIGTDQIRVALIYKPAKVTPVGAYALLTSAVDPTFIDTLNRPVLAQTFEENLTGARFTVAVNHLKSKGSACPGDPDTGDGQGNCNLTRLAAAIAEANWLATDPTTSGDPDFLLIGDMNSYAMEDPIGALLSDGYTNLIDTFAGAHAYSFVFQGQSGYLDHALATSTLLLQATGATEWHINADEPIALDYNVENKSANHVNTLYASDAYRSSDHDPLIVGLDLSHYDFSGFFQPVDNLPIFNTVKAGQSIPIKFSLNGDQGLNIFAAGYPKSEMIACDVISPTDGVEEIATAGSSSLSYDPLTDTYTYVWKTEKMWAGACRQLIVKLDDGTFHRANFNFTK